MSQQQNRETREAKKSNEIMNERMWKYWGNRTSIVWYLTQSLSGGINRSVCGRDPILARTQHVLIDWKFRFSLHYFILIVTKWGRHWRLSTTRALHCTCVGSTGRTVDIYCYSKIREGREGVRVIPFEVKINGKYIGLNTHGKSICEKQLNNFLISMTLLHNWNVTV